MGQLVRRELFAGTLHFLYDRLVMDFVDVKQLDLARCLDIDGLM
jgi:hypothetical protein